MKKKLPFLVFILVLLAGTFTTLAIEYSGEAGAGTETPLSGEASSFCLLHADKGCAASQVIGYRFTVIDCKQNKRGETIDVFRNQYTSVPCADCEFSGIVFWNEYGFNGNALLDAQGQVMSKLRLRASAQNGEAFSLGKTHRNRYKESDIAKSAPLPLADRIGDWIRDEKNYESVCRLCTGDKSLNYGDTILMEPVFACRVEDLCCGLTGSDLARLAISYYGDTVPNGVNGGYSFAWLRKWVHKEFPNYLSVTERSYAKLLGLESGKKLAAMAKPSAILNGAYAMAVGVELSEAQKPALAVDRIEVYQGNTLVQAYDAAGNLSLKAYLKADTAYRFRVYYSAEDSRYRVNRSFDEGDILEITQTFTDEPYTEFTRTFPSVHEEMNFAVREDWVSDRGLLIMRGEEKSFIFYGEPAINSAITLYDLHGDEIPAAYLGQEVQTLYRLDMAFESRQTISYQGTVNGTVVATGNTVFLPGEHKSLWGDITQIMSSDGVFCDCDCLWEKSIGQNTIHLERDFPVVIPDLEITDFYLADATGKKVPLGDAPSDIALIPTVTVLNNTAVGLYADLYMEGETFTVHLDAGECFTWNCKERIIPPGTYEMTAEAYIERQNKSAAWESNQENNVRTLSGKASLKMIGEFADRESNYHEDIDVYLNAFFQNNSNENYRDVIARIRVLDARGKEIFTDRYRFDSPAGTKSLVYAKWHTVKEGAKVCIDFSRDGGATYTHQIDKPISVVALGTSQTPDTRYEAHGRAIKDIDISKKSSLMQGASWESWHLDGDTATLSKPYISVKGRAEVLVPESRVLKSGYSFRFSYDLSVTGDKTLCTDVQSAYVLFPEYDYEFKWQKYDRLNTAENTFSHFTPLWFPDGPYTFLLVLDDIWTPMGRITLTLPGTLSIRGNLYDDWVVTK